MLIAYHGTYAKFVPSILRDGFKCNKNEKHWLGNGIYFYMDLDLAKWWSNTPTKSFGPKSLNNGYKSGDNNSIVLKAEIDSNEDNTIDTRKLENYQWLIDVYPEFEKESRELKVQYKSMESLRCAFFDWLHSVYPVDVVIAGFNKPKKSKTNYKNQICDDFMIPYIEYQLCVFSNELISNVERVDL